MTILTDNVEQLWKLVGLTAYLAAILIWVYVPMILNWSLASRIPTWLRVVYLAGLGIVLYYLGQIAYQSLAYIYGWPLIDDMFRWEQKR